MKVLGALFVIVLIVAVVWLAATNQKIAELFSSKPTPVFAAPAAPTYQWNVTTTSPPPSTAVRDAIDKALDSPIVVAPSGITKTTVIQTVAAPCPVPTVVVAPASCGCQPASCRYRCATGAFVQLACPFGTPPSGLPAYVRVVRWHSVSSCTCSGGSTWSYNYRLGSWSFQ